MYIAWDILIQNFCHNETERQGTHNLPRETSYGIGGLENKEAMWPPDLIWRMQHRVVVWAQPTSVVHYYSS